MRYLQPVLVGLLLLLIIGVAARTTLAEDEKPPSYGYMFKSEVGYDIDLKMGWGTAFPVSRTEWCTAAHLLKISDTDGYYERFYVMKGGDWIHMELVKKDEKLDLALFRCKQETAFYPIAKKDAEVRTAVTFQCSHRGQPIRTEVAKLISPEQCEASRIEHGDSGAPMLHQNEKYIVGMVVATYEAPMNTRFRFVPASTLREFVFKDK